MSEKRAGRARILEFNQPGRFFHKRAQRQIDQYKFLDALSSLRLATQREPEEAEYLMDMAEIYTEMCLYGESNQILFELMGKGVPLSECYFGLGCNFMGMSELNKARDSFQTYLDLDPSGEYAEEAFELLDMLDDDSDGDPSEGEAAKHAARGRRFLDAGEYEQAAMHLERSLTLDASNVAVRNNYALALSCLKRRKDAFKQTKQVLEESPDDVFANCNMAIHLHEDGHDEAAAEIVRKLTELEPYSFEDMSKLCMTLSELGITERALQLARDIEQIQPYDKKTLHHLAALLYNRGDREAATRLWQRIVRLDPENTVAPYYITLARSAATLEAQPQCVSWHFQVPHREMLRRIRLINKYAREGISTLTDKWGADAEFRGLICWGLELTDSGIRRALYHLVSVFRNAASQKILRAALTRSSETDENKREILGMLKQMEAPEPYIALLDGAIVEVRVNVLGTLQRKLPPGFEHILHQTAHILPQRHAEPIVQEAVRLWAAFTSARQDNLPIIRKPEVWNAALEYAALTREGENVSSAEIARLWGVDPRSVRVRAHDILSVSAHPEHGS